MKIQLFQFNKKINSTKRPTGGTEFTITLKEGCDIINPTINLAGVNNPTAYNYAYIPDFKRYYYISNWEANRDRWTASMAVDVLASYKDQIGESTQYVGRSESEYDGNIIDNMYPAVGGFKVLREFTASPWAQTISDGDFVVQIVNSESSELGVSYYALDAGNFSALRAAIGNTKEIFNVIKASMTNPNEYITSCKWFPFKINHDITAINNYGIWAMSPAPAASHLPPNGRTRVTARLNVPKHPQASARGDYLKLSPYSRYSLMIPPFGYISLDSAQLYDSNSIVIEITIDLISGTGTLRLGNEIGQELGTYNSQFSIDIPLNYTRINTGNIASNVLQTAAIVASAALTPELTTAQAVGAGLSAGASVANAALSAMPSVTNITGGGASLTWPAFETALILFYMEVADEHPEAGRPLMKDKKLNTLAGYVQIPDPHFEIAMTDTEMSTLNHAVISGFFYE